MSILWLFELLVFYSLERCFFVLEYRKCIQALRVRVFWTDLPLRDVAPPLLAKLRLWNIDLQYCNPASSWMSLLSPLLDLSISSRMYPHFWRLDFLGWRHFTVKEIILGQCVFLWDQSCCLVSQVRYFSGLSIVNLIFLLYCASNDICFCNIVCMWLYWGLWDMESYFWVHLLY